MSKLIDRNRQNENFRILLPKQRLCERFGNSSKIDRLQKVVFFSKEKVSRATLTCFSSVEFYFMKQTSSKMDVLFLMSILRYYTGVKLSFNHLSVRKNFLISTFRFFLDRVYELEMDQKLNFGETNPHGTRSWNIYFVTPKH